MRQADSQQPNRVQTLLRVIRPLGLTRKRQPVGLAVADKYLDLPSPDPAALIDFLDGQQCGIDHGASLLTIVPDREWMTPTSRGLAASTWPGCTCGASRIGLSGSDETSFAGKSRGRSAPDAKG